MNKKILFIFLFSSIIILAQNFDVRASMGIQYASQKSLRLYLNSNYSLDDEVTEFSSMVLFSGEAGYYLNPDEQLSLEASYALNSYSFNYTAVNMDFSYSILSPTFIYYYVIPGPGYNVKLGGGVGPRLGFVTEDFKFQSNDFFSIGLGGLLKIEANTALSSNLYANIGGDFRYDYIPAPEDNGRKLGTINREANLNTMAFGLHLGVTYIF